MNKFVVFGLGQKYETHKSALFSQYNVIALSDNNAQKHGTVIDGIAVIPPEQIPEQHFDYVIITPKDPRRSQIHRQLTDMGINDSKILYIVQFSEISRYHEIFGTYTRSPSEKLLSSVCRPTDLDSLLGWPQLYGMSFSYGQKSGPVLSIDESSHEYYPHRKIWEHLYICQALEERGMLKPSRNGLCFAAGTEPLPSIFADMGCQITATDAPPEVSGSDGWKATGQHSDGSDDLYYPRIVSREKFLENVSFQYADMNHIPVELCGYDFLWSSCALEHLGSIHAAKDFIYRAMDCLKPGGIAVHTTEFSLTSNMATTIRGGTCPLRSIDLIEIAEQLVWQGHHVEPLDFRLDGSLLDYTVSYPPEYTAPHFKIPFADSAIITSFGLIVRKSL